VIRVHTVEQRVVVTNTYINRSEKHTAFVVREEVRTTVHGVSIQNNPMITGRWRYHAALNTGNNLADFMS
jgi:hypothetical protein